MPWASSGSFSDQGVAMRRLLLLGLVLALTAGCKKASSKFWDQTKPDDNAKTLQQVLTEQKGAGAQPTAHGPSGVVVNPSPGGSSGVAQTVRGRVVTAVNEHEMRNLQQLIAFEEAQTGKMPTAREIADS